MMVNPVSPIKCRSSALGRLAKSAIILVAVGNLMLISIVAQGMGMRFVV